MSPTVERIDFHNPAVGKPANLQNSAVLRMLEEEENRRGGHVGHDEYDPRPLRDVTWPPPDYDQKTHIRSSFKDVVTPGAKRVAWPPPQEGVLDPANVSEHSAVQSQGGLPYSNQSPGLQQNNYPSQQTYQQPQSTPYQQQPSYQSTPPYQQPSQQSYRPLKPLDVSSVGTGSPLTSPAINQSPQGFRSNTPGGGGPKGWAPVQSPVGTPLGAGQQKYFGAAPAQESYSNQPQYQPVSQPFQTKGYQEPGRDYRLPEQSQLSPGGQQQQRQIVQQQSSQQQIRQTTGQQYQQTSQQRVTQSTSQQYQQQVVQTGEQQYQQQFNQPGVQQQLSQQTSGSYLQQQGGVNQPGQQQYPSQQLNQPSGYSQQPAPQQYQSQSGVNQSQFTSQPAVAQSQAAAPRPQPTKNVEPPPSTITLRPAAPVSQTSAPVYSAQPATASLKVTVGGKNLRGDLKWPPDDVRKRMAADEQHLIELSKGPACRPRKQDKNYTPFFEAHALNNAYPGYKIPPGTQFYRPEY